MFIIHAYISLSEASSRDVAAEDEIHRSTIMTLRTKDLFGQGTIRTLIVT
jgi:hypothetical protein